MSAQAPNEPTSSPSMAAARTDFVFPVFEGEVWETDPPREWNFPTQQDYERFTDFMRKVFDRFLDRFRYNSMTSFLAFYNDFKFSGMPSLQEFYDRVYQTDFLVSCMSNTGLCYTFKKQVEKVFKGGEFEKVHEYMYFAPGCFTSSHEPSEKIEDDEPFWPVDQTEQICLVLKFTIGSRRGQFLVNFEYGLNRPIVVMEDRRQPDSDPMDSRSSTGDVKNIVRPLNDKYMLWNVRQGDGVCYRVFYVKRSFLRLDYPEKRLKVNPIQAVMVYREGFPEAGYCTTTEFTLSVFAVDKDTYNPVNLKYDDLLSGEVKNEVLENCIAVLEGDAREKLKEFACLCLDEEFKTQLNEMNAKFRALVDNVWNESPVSSSSGSPVACSNSPGPNVAEPSCSNPPFPNVVQEPASSDPPVSDTVKPAWCCSA